MFLTGTEEASSRGLLLDSGGASTDLGDSRRHFVLFEGLRDEKTRDRKTKSIPQERENMCL